MNNIFYLFYYIENEIVDHDEDGAVFSEVRNNLGAFYNLQIGLEYYRYKYPNKTIQFEKYKVLDDEE